MLSTIDERPRSLVVSLLSGRRDASRKAAVGGGRRKAAVVNDGGRYDGLDCGKSGWRDVETRPVAAREAKARCQ